MKSRIISACVIAACACGLAGASRAAAPPELNTSARVAPARQGDKGAQAPLKLSGGERDAVEKINKAKGIEAKIQAVAEFVKKYPKSEARPRVAELAADEIVNTQDTQLRISLAETYLDIFNEPGEGERVRGMLLHSYIDAERADDAFKAATAWLEKHPDDVNILVRLTILAGNEAVRGNNKYVAQGQQFGTRAAELIEADRRPDYIEAAQWAEYKTRWLPAVYRETGVLAMRAGDKKATRERLEKAAALKSTDPAVYLILSDLAFQDYSALAQQHKVAAAGPERDAALKRAEEQLDRVIEIYAQAVALTEGSEQYKAAHDQLKQDLESYYKYRHNNSTEGLQQLISKYKKAPAQ